MLILTEEDYTAHLISTLSEGSRLTKPGISYVGKLFELRERFQCLCNAEKKARKLLDEGLLCVLVETPSDRNGPQELFLWVEAPSDSEIVTSDIPSVKKHSEPKQNAEIPPQKPEYEMLFRGRKVA